MLRQSESRRAFPLDSRMVWVEQLLVHDIPVPKDNLSLGPGQYHPQGAQGNVSSIIFGRPWSTTTPDRFPNKTLNSTSVISADQRPSTSSLIEGRNSYRDDFSRHQPLSDPGKQRVILGKILGPQDIPIEERCPTRMALPDYDVKHESLVIRSKPKNGKFPMQHRVDPFPGQPEYEPRREYDDEKSWRSNSKILHSIEMSPIKCRRRIFLFLCFRDAASVTSGSKWCAYLSFAFFVRVANP
eukprot:gene12368-26016_t